MSIPLSTTTISVLRPPENEDPFDTTGDSSVIVSGIRAVVSAPRGRDEINPGDKEVIDMVLYCDLCDLQSTDVVTDSATSIVYSVVWVAERFGLGLDHLAAGLRFVSNAGGDAASEFALGGVTG